VDFLLKNSASHERGLDLLALRESGFPAQTQALAQRQREVVPLSLVSLATSRLSSDVLWIETPIPHEDVEPFNLLNKHENRAACRRNLCPRVTLKAGAPLLQHPKLFGIETCVRHGATIRDATSSW